MPRLSPCPTCDTHVLTQDHQCPHCGAPIERAARLGRGAAVLMGLALTGCPEESDDMPDETTAFESEYGAPDTGGAQPGDPRIHDEDELVRDDAQVSDDPQD